ncbi:MAG TPA: GNAT family N-acetyltransferase [Levilinea sp.]|nr:GNAT family N-acetyltransferase [Levilinea sp.]
MTGDIGFSMRSGARQAEIGFTQARPYQGKGFAFEATELLLRYLFEQYVNPRLWASVRLLERPGMRREGHWIESAWCKGK